MGHPRFSDEEIVRRANELYKERVRAQVETPENIGKILILDIETGEYEMDTDSLAANHRALAKHPGAALFGFRIGYDAVVQFRGSSLRFVE